jgi:mono/diheme cytochrome c family protein
MGRYGLALIVGVAIGVIASLVVGVFILGPMIVTHRNDLPLERAYGNFAVSLASRFNSGGAQNPAGQSRQSVQAGRLAFIGSCAECHGATGDGKGVFGSASYPPATDLTKGDPKEMSDAQLFWIVKHGLSFTGMPAFGGQYSDQDIWSLVAYIRSLQNSGTSTSAALAVPTPSVEQLAAANPAGNAAQRGAAVYFAQGCAECHGATGNAPGDLRLRRGERGISEAVRNGRRGMPAYSTSMISDHDLADLSAYMNTIGSTGLGLGGGEDGNDRGPGRLPQPATPTP